MLKVELLSVLTAAISSFALGGIWYSPHTFGKKQLRELQSHGETVPAATARVLMFSFLFTLAEAFAFALIIGSRATLWATLGTGALVGGCFVAAGSGINYMFTGRSAKVWLIDGGFHVARYLTYALVLWAWR